MLGCNWAGWFLRIIIFGVIFISKFCTSIANLFTNRYRWIEGKYVFYLFTVNKNTPRRWWCPPSVSVIPPSWEPRVSPPSPLARRDLSLTRRPQGMRDRQLGYKPFQFIIHLSYTSDGWEWIQYQETHPKWNCFRSKPVQRYENEEKKEEDQRGKKKKRNIQKDKTKQKTEQPLITTQPALPFCCFDFLYSTYVLHVESLLVECTQKKTFFVGYVRLPALESFNGQKG